MYACAHWAALHYNAPVLLLTEVLRMGTHGTEELPALLDGNPVTCVTDGCPTCLEGIPCLERNCLERNCLEGIPTCLEGTQPAYFAQTAGLSLPDNAHWQCKYSTCSRRCCAVKVFLRCVYCKKVLTRLLRVGCSHASCCMHPAETW